MPLDRKNVQFDVDSASLEDLQKIKSLIMGRIIQDLHAKVDPKVAYDSHGSNHTNHSDLKAAAGIANRIKGGTP